MKKSVWKGTSSAVLKRLPPMERISRCIDGHGTWSNKSTPKNVCDEARMVIGIERYFKFEPNEKRKNEPENEIEWKMHEYSLSLENELVLCHITNKADSTKDGNNSTGALKRSRNENAVVGSNYEIGNSSKRGQVEYESPECSSTIINNPAQHEVHQVVDYGVQNQQYTMTHGFPDQVQYVMPNELHQGHNMPYAYNIQDQQYIMPHAFPDQVQYGMAQGHGLQDQQYTMPHGLDGTTNEAFGDEQDRAITSDQPQAVQEGGKYCNYERGTRSLQCSLYECANHNMQIPQEDYQIHVIQDEQPVSVPISGMDDGHGEISDEALVEEIEGMLSDDTHNHAFIDPHDDDEEEDDTHNQLYETHQEQAFYMGNGEHDNTSSFKNSSTGCNFTSNTIGFEHEDVYVDFTWLPAIFAV